MSIFPLDEPFRPAPGRNNVWLRKESPEKALVFVHGVLSDSHGCWYHKPAGSKPGVYWPDLVKRDRRFDEYSIYLGGYETAIDSGPYEVSDCAEELFTALRRPEADDSPAVLDRETIVFVCHSMGGIVVRYLLTAHPGYFKDKDVGLALIASPSGGSHWANWLELLTAYFEHEQSKQLQWGNWSLKDIDDRFQIIKDDEAIRVLFGKEACEQHFVIHRKWAPPIKPLVSRDSAGHTFGRAKMLPGTDHFTCVKPDGIDHPAHSFLVDFCSGMRKSLKKRAPKAQPVQPEAATGIASPTFGLHWDMMVDEEGDVYNEMSYFGLVLPKSPAYSFALPVAELLSGHSSTYDIVRDPGRTSQGVSLEQSLTKGTRRLETVVRFNNRPAENDPASFCLCNHDWNVYSMNMEEYRQKPGSSEDGLDYIEKQIPDRWRLFTLLLRFPEQIIFAKTPFLEVYSYATGKPVRDEALTAQFEPCFYYSKTLRTATLQLVQPREGFSYRVAWLLGESSLAVTASLIPKQRQRQRLFAQRMLKMKYALRGTDVKAAEEQMGLHDAAKSVLASLAQYIGEELQVEDTLDPNELELSLMVLDEEQMEEAEPGGRKLPVLRIVAGTHQHEPPYRELTLFVGDGNAGRAWKRRMGRIFDPSGADPKRHIYVPVSENLRHRFLISLPLIDVESAALIYGIVNIGTFSEGQADLLRPLGEDEAVRKLTAHAQGFVLKRLLETLKM